MNPIARARAGGPGSPSLGQTAQPVRFFGAPRAGRAHAQSDSFHGQEHKQEPTVPLPRPFPDKRVRPGRAACRHCPATNPTTRNPISGPIAEPPAFGAARMGLSFPSRTEPTRKDPAVSIISIETAEEQSRKERNELQAARKALRTLVAAEPGLTVSDARHRVQDENQLDDITVHHALWLLIDTGEISLKDDHTLHSSD